MTDRSPPTLVSLESTSALDVSGGDERLSFTALATDDASG
jgi:hypothetical protein